MNEPTKITKIMKTKKIKKIKKTKKIMLRVITNGQLQRNILTIMTITKKYIKYKEN